MESHATQKYRLGSHRHNKNRKRKKYSVLIKKGNLPVAVVVESVITAKSSQGSESDGVRKEHLSTGIDPDLNDGLV